MTTIYIILTGKNVYVTCFLDKTEAEEFVFEHPLCFIKHEVRE